MGMFTTIINPVSGIDYQIKCGDDICKTYTLGDYVDPSPSEYSPGSGYLLDDVYNGYDTTGSAWVVIKDGYVKEIVPYTWVESDNEDDDGCYNPCSDFDLKAKYQITEPPREWRSEELWQEKEARELKYAEENAAWKATISHLSPKEQLGMSIAKIFNRRLNYADLLKLMITVEPLSKDDE